MRIVVLSDIHGAVGNFSKVGEVLSDADLVLLPGDLTNFGGAEAAAKVIEALGRFNKRILAVAGNCDRPECADYLEKTGINLEGRQATAAGIEFLGIGGALPCPMRTPNERTESDLKRCLDDLAAQQNEDLPCVLVSHQPPRNTGADLAWNGEHVGSASVRAFIERRQPLVCFTGHIHESNSLSTIGPAQIVNPGAWAQGRYAVAEIHAGRQNIELRMV